MTVTQLAATGISGGPGGGGGNNQVDVSDRKIYVANVPYDMPAERLLAQFSKYGEIEEGPLGFDKATGKSRGFALFVYKTAEVARASLADPVKTIDGHQLNCKLAIEGKKKPGPVGPQGSEGHNDGIGVGMPGGIAGQYAGYGGFSGPSLSGNQMNSSLDGVGMGAGAPGLSGIGSQGVGSSLGVGGELGPCGGGTHYGGPGSTGYGGLGGGIGGLSGVGSGAGRGSFYGLPPSSGGMPTGDYQQGPAGTGERRSERTETAAFWREVAGMRHAGALEACGRRMEKTAVEGGRAATGSHGVVTRSDRPRWRDAGGRLEGWKHAGEQEHKAFDQK